MEVGRTLISSLPPMSRDAEGKAFPSGRPLLGHSESQSVLVDTGADDQGFRTGQGLTLILERCGAPSLLWLPWQGSSGGGSVPLLVLVRGSVGVVVPGLRALRVLSLAVAQSTGAWNQPSYGHPCVGAATLEWL